MTVFSKVLGSFSAIICTAALLAFTTPGVSLAKNSAVKSVSTVSTQVNSAVRSVASMQMNASSTGTAAGTPANAQESETWSGYIAQGHTFNQVQAEFTVPTVVCSTANSNVLLWVGFDGYNESRTTVEQVGIGADCGAVNSKPTYYAWWEMYPTNTIQKISSSTVSVRAGDQLFGTVTYTGSSSTKYTLRIRDVRTNQAKNVYANCGSGQTCRRGTAEFIAERKTLSNGTYSPLAKWNSDPSMFINAKASYTSTISLKPISSYSNQPINMVDYYNTGHTLATVSYLTQGGTTFSSAWKTSK